MRDLRKVVGALPPFAAVSGWPPLIRLYVTQCLVGFGLSALFVAGLLAFDLAGLRHLVLQDAAGPLAVAMLWVANGIVFSGAQFAFVVLRMGETEDGPGGGTRARIPEHAMVPVPVENRAQGRVRNGLRGPQGGPKTHRHR